ncbi:BBP7 family outer membrane beta-barrel protein [Rosistilla carotiformis]|uniref:BBP7 family outer membrane beta-barrel protein n=1 Tax=Rosistilla carotiformis TaxID=2528017 RepID=UPI0018D260BC|nr:BBP7 family outer membrane beta-barrel protein [Rosistilla carotiformis]
MSKKRIIIVAAFACLTAIQAWAAEPREKVASSAERIARARWQPIRQPIDESLEELPSAEPEIISSEMVPFADGEVIVEEGDYYDYDDRYREGAYYGTSGDQGCDGCGSGCNSCRRGRGWSPLFCVGVPSDGWFSAEYLMWWQKGMNLPPLVTTSATTADAGVLGRGTTRTLFGGNDDYVTDSLNGMRFRLGFWLDACHRWGIEAEHFGLDTERDSFSASGDGSPILARPFFNMENNANDSELVSFPNVVNGRVSVDVTSSLEGTGVHLRRLWCCSTGCAELAGCCLPRAYTSRIEGLVGWRRLQLSETLGITENLDAADGSGSFDINDQFNTRTHFNGFNFGVLYHRQRGPWSLDLAGKFAIGSNRQSVSIAGSTVITTDTVEQYDSGILAGPSNIGQYERNRFAIVPEIGITGGYNWTPNLRFTLGYTFIYWNNVVRPGDQVDLDLNPSQFPPAIVGANASQRPGFQFNETDYWVQGWSIGAEYRF